ncbi:MAG: hypothetical protein IPL96_14670 [Holophagaceae bacterium]|nr:hypothetical protein [Holophagaceae bacterium]
MYFLPLIKAHTDSLLSGHFLNALWSLGSGWVPWENAQVGPLYFPYHVANLVARLLGEPLAILDVSACLHVCASGVVVYAYGDEDLTISERIAWAGLAMVQPGPLLLGLNWHNYLTSTPWFLALLLHLRRQTRLDVPWSRRDRLALVGLNVGFYLSSHAQMFVIGWVLLSLWAFHESRWNWRAFPWLPVVAGMLPLMSSLLFLKLISGTANPDWMVGREDPNFILRHGLSLRTVLQGSLLGNLVVDPTFSLWADIRKSGGGMFFNLPLLTVLAWALLKRRWSLASLLAGCIVFLSAKSFPWLSSLAYGPFAGFRWTWKLVIFTGPLALVALMGCFREMVPKAFVRTGLLTMASLLSLSVCIKGLDFEIFPSLAAAHGFGAPGLVAETQRMARSTGLPPGSRIALVGFMDMMQPVPLPVLGLIGNAPILSGLETAHIYEPLEDSRAARSHFGLSLPWRAPVSAEGYAQYPAKVEEALSRIGVDALVTLYPDILPGAMAYHDSLGRVTYVKRLAPMNSFPWARLRGQDIALKRMPGGVLRTAQPQPEPPDLCVPREVVWTQAVDGHWLATPRGPSLFWLVFTLLGFTGAMGLSLRGVGASTTSPRPAIAPDATGA